MNTLLTHRIAVILRAISVVVALACLGFFAACDSREVREERKKLEQERIEFAAETARAKLAAEEKVYEAKREVNQRAAELVAERAALERTADEAKQQVAELAQEKNAAEKISAESQQQTNALNAAVDASKQYQQQQTDRAARARALSEAVMAAQEMKLAATEYYQSEGKWPANNKAIGLPASESYRAETLRSVAIEPFEKAARIRVRYINESGVEQQLFVLANVSNAGQATWRCVSPDVRDIQEFIPGCRYQAM